MLWVSIASFLPSCADVCSFGAVLEEFEVRDALESAMDMLSIKVEPMTY